MQAVAVIKHGDVSEIFLLRHIGTRVVSPLHPFLLQGTKEVFHDGTTPAIAFAAHGAF